jgi:2-(1,2-epoxy-1,2-dihydrophenyl)acetyl-CoA isomerase
LKASGTVLDILDGNGSAVAQPVMEKTILTAMETSYAEQLLAEAEGQRIAGDTADAK